jgi:hypothetical protein
MWLIPVVYMAASIVAGVALPQIEHTFRRLHASDVGRVGFARIL